MVYGREPSAMQKRCKITRCVYQIQRHWTAMVTILRGPKQSMRWARSLSRTYPLQFLPTFKGYLQPASILEQFWALIMVSATPVPICQAKAPKHL